MIKNRVLFEEKVNERIYQFYCDADSPLGELHDVLMKWKGYTVERMQSAQAEEQEIKNKMCEIDNEECTS